MSHSGLKTEAIKQIGLSSRRGGPHGKFLVMQRHRWEGTVSSPIKVKETKNKF